ncbi:DUF3054 domain-containing protein [Ilumatobacter nonamiensis]|uniref:DUF3054 domain-containing protein n=1 Tax=Ilumatobacter nonamiensis TaxID=467093 RepID=UPI00034D5DCF|nr:DUF3054 domain-containing protein [Ilumatobacter nonamiensis]
MDKTTTRLAIAAGVDTAVVVAFVAIGRNNHDEDPGIAGLFSTAAPLLIGLAIGWLVARAWDQPFALRTGLVVWPVTVAAGMIVRRILGDGTALSFVIVATIFLGVFLVGWRAARLAIVSRRHIV